MNLFQSFDEMIKYKLHKKEYPFNEAHWNEMEKLLDSPQSASPDIATNSRPFRKGIMAGLVAGMFISGFAVGAYFYHQNRSLSPMISVADKTAMTNDATSISGYDASSPSVMPASESIENERVSEDSKSSPTFASTENRDANKINPISKKIASSAPAVVPLAKELIAVDHSASNTTTSSSQRVRMDSHTIDNLKTATLLPTNLSLPSAEKIKVKETEASKVLNSSGNNTPTLPLIHLDNNTSGEVTVPAETEFIENPPPSEVHPAFPKTVETSPRYKENSTHPVSPQSGEISTPPLSDTPSTADASLLIPNTKELTTGSKNQKAKDNHSIPKTHNPNSHFYHKIGLSYRPLFTQLSTADNKNLSHGIAAGYHFGFKKRFELLCGIEYFYTRYQSHTFFQVVNAGYEPLESFYQQHKLGIPLLMKIKPAKNKVLSPYFTTGAITQLRLSSHYHNLVNKIQVQEATEMEAYPILLQDDNTDVPITLMESSTNKNFSFSVQAEAGIAFSIRHNICINAGWLYRRELSGQKYFQKSPADNGVLSATLPYIFEVKKTSFSYSGISLGLAWKMSK